MNAHEASVKSALRTGDDLDRLIGRLGSAAHPRGEVLTTYRTANRGLAQELNSGNTWGQRGVADVLDGLRRSMRDTAQRALLDAQALGVAQAQAQLAVNGIPVQDIPPAMLAMQVPSISPALAAWMATVEAQAQATTALIATGADATDILGDAGRAGILRPAPVIAEGARWLSTVVSVASVAVIGWILGRGAGGQPTRQAVGEWSHQVVAGIDERTTDCCLRAHGQVQPLSQPFRLTGTPRYADKLEHPPFHWYCRSSECLVPARAAEDAVTAEMRDAARAELRARKDGSRVEIHPAHARSRRPGVKS